MTGSDRKTLALLLSFTCKHHSCAGCKQASLWFFNWIFSWFCILERIKFLHAFILTDWSKVFREHLVDLTSHLFAGESQWPEEADLVVKTGTTTSLGDIDQVFFLSNFLAFRCMDQSINQAPIPQDAAERREEEQWIFGEWFEDEDHLDLFHDGYLESALAPSVDCPNTRQKCPH